MFSIVSYLHLWAAQHLYEKVTVPETLSQLEKSRLFLKRHFQHPQMLVSRVPLDWRHLSGAAM
jgi:hypothetical protein